MSTIQQYLNSAADWIDGHQNDALILTSVAAGIAFLSVIARPARYRGRGR